MADNNNVETPKENESSVIESLDDSYLNDKMVAVSNLVMVARLQAKEAEIRSRYAREFANRAVNEAMAAHQVSTSLAKTSRMVAALALEFSNETNILNESFVDSENDSRYSSFLSTDVSLQSAGDQCSFSNECNNASIDESSTSPVDSKPNLKRYDAQFPEDVEVNHDPVSSEKLPTVYEDSSNEPNHDSGDVNMKTKHSTNRGQPDLAEELKNLDIRRKMMLYRDSKLMTGHFTPTSTVPEVIQHTYTEQATQTDTVTV